MRALLVALVRKEIELAVRLEALGAFWADRAVARLGKLSAKFPGRPK